MTQSSPTGSQCLPAVGCAEAGRYISRRNHEGLPGCSAHDDEIVYVSMGEGATSEGEFWESLNTACSFRLPVLYVVADNGYAISVPARQQSPGPISELVKGFPGLAVHRIDGRDYFEVRKQAPGIVAAVRQGTGPALVHATVNRPYSHSSADTQSKYRPKQRTGRRGLDRPYRRAGTGNSRRADPFPDGMAEMREEARKLVAEAAKEALAGGAAGSDHGAEPPARAARCVARGVFGRGSRWRPGQRRRARRWPWVRRSAWRLHEAMSDDVRVRVFGEDVADAPEELLDELEGKGGVFGTTFGLQRKFGSDRCYNTPLAEANIVGRAVGQAMRGLRPVPEVQFFDYIWTAMQQIKSEAATVRWRSAGDWSCPMVLRVPIGGYLAGGAIWHSQSGVSIFAQVPGLVIVMPSRTVDAVGLLRTALSGEDPVLFLEHKHLLRQRYTEGPFPAKGFRLPFGKGRIAKPGRRPDNCHLWRHR